MPRVRHTCQPGQQCFNCPYPDCEFSGDLQKTETALKRSRRASAEKINNGNYSPIKLMSNEQFINQGIKTTVLNKTVLEEMLQRQYGGKLEPVTGSRRRQAPRAK
jgi:hypothetical protein